MATKLQIRNDTTENWLLANPILEKGEPGYESSTNKIKFGDGLTEWNKLPYLNTEMYDDTEIKEEITNIKNTLNDKANIAEVYTKEEIDNLKYIDEDELTAKNYMAKDEALDEFYTKTVLDNKLSEKADKNTTYTKTEVDTKLVDKADVSELPEETSLMNGQAPVIQNIDKTTITTITGLIDELNSILGLLRQRNVIK